jgi:hypothetical protein
MEERLSEYSYMTEKYNATNVCTKQISYLAFLM